MPMERLSTPLFHPTDAVALHRVPGAATAAWRAIRAQPWVAWVSVLAWVSILAWVSGCSLEQVHGVSSGEENPQEGHRARRRQVSSFQFTQCLPSLALGMPQQALGYCFHRKVFL